MALLPASSTSNSIFLNGVAQTLRIGFPRSACYASQVNEKLLPHTNGSIWLGDSLKPMNIADPMRSSMTVATSKAFPLSYPPSEHERNIVKLFSNGLSGCPDSREAVPFPTVFICFTNRCGSNFLTEALASTGKFPVANEFFNWDHVAKFSRDRSLGSFEEFCWLLMKERSKHGIFASKIGWSQLYFLAKASMIPRVFGVPKFIHIRRRDLLAQAVSFSIAAQTSAWTSRQKAQGTPTYNAKDIQHRIHGLAHANARLEEFFAVFGFPFFEIVYEDLLRDLPGAMGAVTEWLALGPCTPDLSKIRLAQQRDDVNAEWRARFIAESRDNAGLPPFVDGNPAMEEIVDLGANEERRTL